MGNSIVSDVFEDDLQVLYNTQFERLRTLLEGEKSSAGTFRYSTAVKEEMKVLVSLARVLVFLKKGVLVGGEDEGDDSGLAISNQSIGDVRELMSMVKGKLKSGDTVNFEVDSVKSNGKGKKKKRKTSVDYGIYDVIKENKPDKLNEKEDLLVE